jgi:DNA-directed RNA polymerase beta subunit
MYNKPRRANMNDIDAVASLFNQPLPTKLTKAGTPELSDLIKTRILEEANKPAYVSNTRLPYMTYDDMADSDIYDPTDFPTVGNLIRNNVAKAITERFPVVGDKYTLAIENLAYEKQKNRRLADEKAILQQEKSLMDRLRGDWVLIDNATGKVVERKSATILNVPRMTERGTFIRNGSELGLKHMFRLKPGIYARVKGDGTPSVHINPAQTTGRQMSLNMDQSTGVMSISRGTRTYGVLPLLRAAGVSDDAMKASWGEELFDIQKNKYIRILNNNDQMSEYKKLWDEGFAPIQLDEETTLSTMGKAYKAMSPEVLLGAANKAVKLSRSMSVDDEDDRDSLAYQRIMGPADYIPERIVRDGGGLLRKMFQRVLRDGNLNSIESGAFQPQVDSVFTEDKHAGYIDGASPFEGLDFASGVSRIGEGGIGDIKAAPAETRGVNDSYLGFIDPVRSPESLKVGLEVYLTYGVRKDSKGNLYANFIDKTGEAALRPMGVVAKSIVATPEYYDPSANPEEFIPAFNRGKGIEYIKRKDVDFFLANSNNMMSVGAGMIPNIGGIRSNRTLMGSKYPLQALSLKHREAPLVQRELTADGEDSTTERRVAKQLGAKFSPVDGRVVSVTDDEMVVRDREGTKHTIDLYNMYPANQKGYLHNTPVVEVGDRVKANQLLAESNYTKGDSGALGTNLKVAYISGHGAEAFEDAIAISESASKKLASEQLHKFRGDLSSDTSYDKQRFISLFGDNEYTQEQLDKIDENGMPKVGVEFKKGDPVFLGIQIRDLSTSGLSRNASVPYVKTWEHDAPGTVIDVVKGRKHMTVYTRSFTPMQLGDKLCFDDKTEIMTKRGWVLFQDLLADDEVLTMDIKTGDNFFSQYSSAFKYYCKKEAMYHLTSKRLDIFTTLAHKHVVAPMNNSRYLALQSSEQVFGKHRWFPTSCNIEHESAFASNREDGAKERYETYTGWVYCVTVPNTNTVFVRRNGKTVWSGNSARYGNKGTVSKIIPDNEMIRDENGEIYDIIQSPLGLPSRCYDELTEFLTKDRGWQFGKDILDTDELYCFDPETFTGRFDKQIAPFHRQEYSGTFYSAVNADVDFCVTAGHKMFVSHGKEFHQTLVEQCYDRYCEFPVVTPRIKRRVVAVFGMEWTAFTGSGMVYCPSVATGYVLTRRNGKLICLGNTNPAQLGEIQLSKVAKHLGKPVAVPDFITDDTIYNYADKMLKKYGLKSSSRIFDPRSNKYIDDIEDGYLYYYKLKHMSELKERGRGTGTYSAEEVPMKGAGAARRLGMMETSAVYSGGGMDVLKDAKLIRGQRNDEFWRKYRNGETPDIPGTPLVHKKFFSHLIASGANIERTVDGGFKLSAATNDDIRELTGNRRVQAAATFDSKNMHPIAGGLFDQTIFGDEGDRWGYYELPEPVLNPLMFKPIASILGWSDKELREYLQGARKVDNEFGPESLMKRLDSLDLEAELRKAKDVLKAPRTTIQQRDLARKRIRAIHPLLQEGIKPSQLFFTRMPILPPRFRAVTVINGGDTNIAADANFLYKRMIDAADDLSSAKGNLPEEFQVDARESLYNAVNAVVGLMPTDDPKLESKGVSGLLKWAFGKGSPKLGSVHRKVFGSNLDMGGLGTITPNSNLTIDQVGIPEESAWSMFEPFVVRELRQNGYSMVQAMREVLERSDEAKRELLRVMKKRPILVNRAPTLWRYGIQGMYPVIVDGRAIQLNPNVCKVYNADFDGDSMTTHVPVSQTAIEAIDKNMLPSRNLLSPQNFKAHFIPRDASNEGLFLASRIAPGKPIRFRTEAEAQAAYDRGEIAIDTPIEIGG